MPSLQNLKSNMSHGSVDLSSLPFGSSVEVAIEMKWICNKRDVSTTLDIRVQSTG